MSDLISRQSAIDALEEYLDYLQMLNKDENPTAESKWYGVNWARNTIANLPSAEPKCGKWIDKRSWMGLECSRCKYHSQYVTPFCPQCGARMDGEL